MWEDDEFWLECWIMWYHMLSTPACAHCWIMWYMLSTPACAHCWIMWHHMLSTACAHCWIMRYHMSSTVCAHCWIMWYMLSTPACAHCWIMWYHMLSTSVCAHCWIMWYHMLSTACAHCWIMWYHVINCMCPLLDYVISYQLLYAHTAGLCDIIVSRMYAYHKQVPRMSAPAPPWLTGVDSAELLSMVPLMMALHENGLGSFDWCWIIHAMMVSLWWWMTRHCYYGHGGVRRNDLAGANKLSARCLPSFGLFHMGKGHNVLIVWLYYHVNDFIIDFVLYLFVCYESGSATPLKSIKGESCWP